MRGDNALHSTQSTVQFEKRKWSTAVGTTQQIFKLELQKHDGKSSQWLYDIGM
jgi:hypothetical protein